MLFRRKRKFFELAEELEAERRARELEDLPDELEISILIDTEVFERLGLDIALEGGEWRPSKYKTLWYRVDGADPRYNGLRHVAVAKSEHRRAKNQQASWTTKGSRHDRKTFNEKFGSQAKVREVARKALGLAPDFALESEGSSGASRWIAETPTTSEDGSIAYLRIRAA
ncbi:MAG: DUF6367 family protein [Nevskia sp.]|nr:DUF6367 family protein [Nevskia sp.]